MPSTFTLSKCVIGIVPNNVLHVLEGRSLSPTTILILTSNARIEEGNNSGILRSLAGCFESFLNVLLLVC